MKTHPLGKVLRPLVLLAIFSFAVASPGAVINQVQSNNTPGQSWIISGVWSNNAAPTSANDYVSGVGMVLRSPTTANSTFGGNSLTINGSQLNLTGATGSAGVVSIGDLRATGGAAIVNGNGGNHAQTLTGGTLSVTNSMFFRLNASDTDIRQITVSSQITGDGTIGLMQKGTLTLDNSSNSFSGFWSIGGVDVTILGVEYSNTSLRVSTLNASALGSLGLNSSLIASDYGEIRVGYDWITGGSVTLNPNSVTFLDTNWTVGALTINGTSLGIGTYDYEFLNSTYAGYFNTTGAGGSITVVPEPGSLGLVFAALGLHILRRRLKEGDDCA